MAWHKRLYKAPSVVKKPGVRRAAMFRMAGRGELALVKISERATRVALASIERAIAECKAKS
jgi:predicted DNA-binding transcriptional regulator AlpA